MSRKIARLPVPISHNWTAMETSSIGSRDTWLGFSTVGSCMISLACCYVTKNSQRPIFPFFPFLFTFWAVCREPLHLQTQDKVTNSTCASLNNDTIQIQNHVLRERHAPCASYFLCVVFWNGQWNCSRCSWRIFPGSCLSPPWGRKEPSKFRRSSRS